jgi:hypothetical protein
LISAHFSPIIKKKESRMTHLWIKIPVGIVLILWAMSGLLPAAEAETLRAEEPVLLTSCGQSPGPVMLKVVLQRIGVNFEMETTASTAELAAGHQGQTPYKTLIIVMGASLKGMGAAGISMDDELKRTAALIAEARSRGIRVIGAHIEGMKRRSQGAAAGDTTDEQSIDAVAPNSDILLINVEGNADGRFSSIAAAGNIPMIEVEKNMDLMTELKTLFGK